MLFRFSCSITNFFVLYLGILATLNFLSNRAGTTGKEFRDCALYVCKSWPFLSKNTQESALLENLTDEANAVFSMKKF